MKQTFKKFLALTLSVLVVSLNFTREAGAAEDVVAHPVSRITEHAQGLDLPNSEEGNFPIIPNPEATLGDDPGSSVGSEIIGLEHEDDLNPDAIAPLKEGSDLLIPPLPEGHASSMALFRGLAEIEITPERGRDAAAGELVAISLAERPNRSQFDSVLADEGPAPVLEYDPLDGFTGSVLDDANKRLTTMYQERATRRFDKLSTTVAAARHGPFGLYFPRSKFSLFPPIMVTYKGTIKDVHAIDQEIKSGSAEAEQWQLIQQDFRRYHAELDRINERNKREQGELEQRKAKILKDTLDRQTLTRLESGRKLRDWGVPSVISVQKNEGNLLEVRLHYPNGQAARLGHGIVEMMDPLLANKTPTARLRFLRRVKTGAFHLAVEHLHTFVDYISDIDYMGNFRERETHEDTRRERETHEDSVLVKLAHLEAARDSLVGRAQPRDKAQGLGYVPEERQLTFVLKSILTDIVAEYKASLIKGMAKSTFDYFETLLLSFHALMGYPVLDAQSGERKRVTLSHWQLMSILAEFQRRVKLGYPDVPADVLKAVIRYFPSGESIWRLKIHELWKDGNTGEGAMGVIIDQGVSTKFPEVRHAIEHGKLQIGKNFALDKEEPTQGNHGTAMAALAVSLVPGGNILHIQAFSNIENSDNGELSPKTDPMIVEETDRAIFNALDAAEAAGADVILIGGGAPGGLADDIMAQRIAQLAEKGIIVVAPVGNERSGEKPPRGLRVASPAAAAMALAVGSADYHGIKARDSVSDIVKFRQGPPRFIHRPDGLLPGLNVPVAKLLPSYEDVAEPYGPASGTSIAADHMFAIALMMVSEAKKKGLRLNTPTTINNVKIAVRSHQAAERKGLDIVLQDAHAAVQEFVRLLSLKPN